MGTLRIWIAASAAAIILTGCTPGASSAPSGNGFAGGMLVGESLIKYGQTSSQFGMVGGFSPNIIVVATGTVLQFHNEDSFDHTASSVGGSVFPSGNPIKGSAQGASGTDVSQTGWSSGVLQPNAYSQPLGTSKIGTYLFGCLFHYPLMRGVIIVQ
jgi:plastocyanin